MSLFDVAMKDHGRIKQVSTFSLIVVCALLWLLLPQNKHRGIPGTAVFFHGKYRGRNFEYRPSLPYSVATAIHSALTNIELATMNVYMFDT